MTFTREPLDITIDRGNALSFALTFYDALSNTEIDMEAYAPFVGIVRHATRTDVLATMAVTADGGKLDILLEPSDTADLALTGNVPHIWGVRDSQGTLWMRGEARVVGSPAEL